ncbi:MAG: hybrid sensor histidine kinase/response regulator [Cytophagaceae bacterium]|nr:hybrid sensor histidine kinase/response regulator [Cytophagaceae bacterium]|tara:strand:- start:41241 stop:43442 length:2202 start_codon:yes stop_codon:yes gene_type:complete
MYRTKALFYVFFLLIGICHAQDGSQNVEATNTTIDTLFRQTASSIEKLDYKLAITKLTQAKELAISINNKSKMALSSSLLATIYLARKEYDNARIESAKAINLQQELEDLQELAKSYLTYGRILLIEDNTTDAKDYLLNAQKYFDDFDNNIYLARTQLYLGKLYSKEGNLGEALTTLTSAEKTLEKYPSDKSNNSLKANIPLEIAKARHRLNEDEIALGKATIALDLAREKALPEIEVDALLALSKINNSLGNYEEAYKKLNEYQEKQQLYFGTNGTQLSQTVYNQIAPEIDPDRYDPKLRNRISKITTVLVIALFTILCLLALSLYKNNSLRAKANELLQAKNTELMIAKDNAEKASMVKAQFLSTITHELRTPMYAVTGLTHLLLNENPTEEQKKHLDSLKFSGEYLLSLINNILDLNKLEANKVEVEQTTFNLRKRVDDVIFALERSAQEKGNKLKIEFDKDIPEQIIGDPLMISQILINLVGNGNKFTRDGEVTVRVQKKSQTDSQIYLHFEVEDTGEGISKKKQKNIFQNFTQGSVQINRKFGGTGLGLSIVKRLLDLQGSRIELESTLGKGSNFHFDIKYGILRKSAETDKEVVYDIDYDALIGKHILIVEDNKINQMITRKILEKNKMTCDVADDGEIALEKIKNETYDLVLMDIHMPGISGTEATKEVRKYNKELPILALTAVTIDENIDDFYLAGFSDVIPKPYKVEEFFSKIYNSLQRKKVNV